MKRMMISISAASAALAAGMIAFAGDKPDAENMAPRFVSYDTLLDASIKSALDADHAADVDDLVVDSRTGRAAYAIVDTNKILGSENSVVAIPYGALTWNPIDKQYTLNATAEQIKSLPKIDPKDLTPLSDASWNSTMRAIFGDRDEFRDLDNMRGDEYSWYFSDSKPESLNGKVVAIHQDARTAKGATCCAIDVQTDKGEKHLVYLAPVAYLNDHALMPPEGSTVTVTSVKAMNADGQVIRVAQTVKVNGKTVELRDAHGQPDWDSTAGPMPANFYVLATKMDNGALMSQGQKFGSVNDILFEPRSGSAAFAIVSVGGVLGVNDTVYPVPYSAFSFGRDNNIFIDMPIEKLKLAKLSKDGIEDLNKPEFVKTVDGYFAVKPARYNLDRPSKWGSDDRSHD